MPLAVLLHGCEKPTETTPITAKDIQPGNEEPPPVEITAPPTISGDNLHIAWPQQTQNGKLVVVIDGQARPEEYDDISPIIFSPDSSYLVYVAGRGNRQYMVVDDRISKPVFKADGVEYTAERNGNIWPLCCRQSFLQSGVGETVEEKIGSAPGP